MVAHDPAAVMRLRLLALGSLESKIYELLITDFLKALPEIPEE